MFKRHFMVLSNIFISVTDTLKVKKTDLPALPPSIEQDALPSLDEDTEDTAETDDEEDDIDDEEEMMADEAADTDDDDYDSDEENDDRVQEDEDSWDNLSKPQDKSIPSADGSTTTTSSSTTTGKPSVDQASPAAANAAAAAAAAAIDPYFTHFDPHAEHQSYKVKVRQSRPIACHLDFIIIFHPQDAQQRLEETHREKVTRVMKDWSDLEEKYQDMRLADPKSAQTFKQRMTARFQVSVR